MDGWIDSESHGVCVCVCVRACVRVCVRACIFLSDQNTKLKH